MGYNRGEVKAMDLQDAIKNRTSIRQFKDAKIDTDTIGVILRMGMCAPSASDRRPWRIWVVENEDLIATLSTATPHASPVAGAPLVIVVGNDPSVSTGMGVIDCSAVTQNMLLAVTDLGLGAVWIGTWPHDDRQNNVRGILGIPDNIEVVSMIAIGHPAETPVPKDKWDPGRVTWL
jgi:nitroreductase